jgi:hypothetical protein
MNEDPWDFASVLLSTVMVPPYFSAIYFEIQSPRPVPMSRLVVKKGSKMRGR